MKGNLFTKLALVAICAVMALSLAGCNSGGGEDSTGTNAGGEVVESIGTDGSESGEGSAASTGGGEIIMGTNAEFAPFEFVATENPLIDNFDGIDIAIALEIGKELGKSIKIENMPFDSLLVALETGKVDFVMAGMTVTEERKQNADFSNTYYVAKQVIIVPEASEVKSAADLNGKAVGVVLGYTGDMIMSETEAVLTRYNKGADAVMDLVNGKIDAVVIDSAPAASLAAKNPGLVLVEDAAAFENEEYAIAVKKGNTELLNEINAALQKLQDAGAIEAFGQKYQE
ncbi:MAG: transporter substrate-binding domain-containing protein [Clostridiales bacterium]|jgi:polar amino acid transport system substrate-binding protein|nr:transporter substrate-binding domain-containing protein [Clostridiales bacterium]